MPDIALVRTLCDVAGAMADARDPWWIIGSAAVTLHGVDTAVEDVDVLLSVRDADRVAARLAIDLRGGTGSGRFRSERYGRWNAPPLAVEFMAALRVRDATAWTLLIPRTTMAAPCGTAIVPVPGAEEMVAILTRFGRPKDLRRAAMLCARLS